MKCRANHSTAMRRAAQAETALHVACAVAVAIVLTPAPSVAGEAPSPSRTDTLWIFDADFEDLLGDNAGWTTEDLSGTVACENYWHKDTIRIGGFEYLGDSTWWCGTYDSCWRQPRGYGNNWTCMLSRSFPEVAAGTDPGDPLYLEYDQRWAIEACYDYGYTDISTDGGASWTTIWSVDNPGFACSRPGMSQDWDSTHPGGEGHMFLDIGDYSGQVIDLRFRFESDYVISSQDYYVNPPEYSTTDGAWQLDNIHLLTLQGYEEVTLFLDDCESPGPSGWVTDDTPASGQTGVVYRRLFEEFDEHEGWMMAAYDSLTDVMAGGQRSWLYSPPIDLAGASEFVVEWDGWVDLPSGDYSDWVEMRYMTSDDLACLERHLPTFQYCGWRERDVEPPVWVSRVDTTLYHASGNWLELAFIAGDWDELEPHGVGIAFDRIRVGIPGHTGVPDGGDTWVSRAHPNPAGPTTTVRYTLPSRSRVTVRVYDLSGRLVRTLLDDVAGPGEHRAVWDGATDTGDRAASGVYFVKLEAGTDAGTFREARKVVLLK